MDKNWWGFVIFIYMVGYIYLITDTTNGMKYTGKHHYHIEGQLDPSYHGSGTIIKNIYKKRPETLREEYIKTCYSEEELCSDEQYYIKLFKTLWPNGYNLTEGGDGGEIPCEEIRKKISKAHKGKHLSDETKKKMSESRKGRHFSDETKKKLSESRKGKHLSDETKKKLSELNKGRPSGMLGKKHSEETIKKISESLKGKPAHNKGIPMSEETKRKLSESLKGRNVWNKGKHLSDETKKKLSELNKGRTPWNKGKHHSEESKIKMSESHKGKHLSDETKKKLSEINTNNKLSKPVLQLSLSGDLIKEWESIQECGRNGFNIGHVCNCCNGKEKTHKGFRFQYK